MYDPEAEWCCDGYVQRKLRFERCCGYAQMLIFTYFSFSRKKNSVGACYKFIMDHDFQ